jgi:hypothetical protein
MEFNSCIELTTIFNIEKLKMDVENDVEIILIVKDNLLDLICSELICEFLTQKNLAVKRLEYPWVGNSKYILRGYSTNTEIDSKNGICSFIEILRHLPTERIGVVFGDNTDLHYNTVVFTQYTNQWVLLEALSCQVKSRKTIIYPDCTMTQNR